MKAKKSLGQHFLRSKTALMQIIGSASLSALDLVLEIGPGTGALTHALLATGARVVAVEADRRCVDELEKVFEEEIALGRLVLLYGDIRDEATQQKLFLKKHLGNTPYKLVANIPYYITGMLFRLFLESLRQPKLLVFLVQKEVAELIVAKDGKEGILSLSVKAFGSPRIVARVKKEAFSPPPKVDSAIIAVENISQKHLGALSSELYFTIVKAGLSARRKMLLGNLSKATAIPKERLEEIFNELRLSPQVRGEDLSSESWIILAKKLSAEFKKTHPN